MLRVLFAVSLCLPTVTLAQQANEKTFASPGDAVAALYGAIKAGNSQSLAGILGSNSDAVLHTGDDVLLDGHEGLLILNPSEETLARYPEMTLNGTPVFVESAFLNQLKTLPVRLNARV